MPRLPALDAVRAVALLLGIALHATLSFVPQAGPDAWPISDMQKSSELSVLMFVIHVFRMSVFFLVAGFLGRALLQSKGIAAFCKNRAARIALPLLLAWPICFVLIVAAVLWALARANGGHLPTPLPDPKTGLNFLHLWFLYLLIWLYGVALAVRVLMRWVDPGARVLAAADQWLRVTCSATWGAIPLAMPIALALYTVPGWFVWGGVPTPGYTLVPPAASFAIYLWVFGLGWMLQRQPQLLEALASRWMVHLAWGSLGVLACLGTAGQQARTAMPLDDATQLSCALAYGLATMAWALAFVGVFVRYVRRENKALRYLADASYWMYLLHLPLVMALQTWLMDLPWHWGVKFVMINVFSALILLASYEVGVRYTWIGAVLSGQKKTR